MNIEEIIHDCLKDKLFGEEDTLEARTILTWMDKGQKEAEKVSKPAVKNLIKMGFVENGKLIKDKGDDSIWFVLAIAGAKGYIKQS